MFACFPLALPNAYFRQQGCRTPPCTRLRHPCDCPQPSAKQSVNIACNLKTPPRGLSHHSQQMVSLTRIKSAVVSTYPTGLSAGAKPSCLGRLFRSLPVTNPTPSSPASPHILQLFLHGQASHAHQYCPGHCSLNGLLSVTNLGVQSPQSGLTTEGPEQFLFLILLFLVPTVITTPC